MGRLVLTQKTSRPFGRSDRRIRARTSARRSAARKCSVPYARKMSKLPGRSRSSDPHAGWRSAATSPAPAAGTIRAASRSDRRYRDTPERASTSRRFAAVSPVSTDCSCEVASSKPADVARARRMYGHSACNCPRSRQRRFANWNPWSQHRSDTFAVVAGHLFRRYPSRPCSAPMPEKPIGIPIVGSAPRGGTLMMMLWWLTFGDGDAVIIEG
jgi:hypothetical protein